MPESRSERPRTSQKGRHNKIYRTPSTPPPESLMEKEKGFILDCNAASSISTDYSKTNPKLGPVIPPYNSQKDSHVGPYFQFEGVQKTLALTKQLYSRNLISQTLSELFDKTFQLNTKSVLFSHNFTTFTENPLASMPLFIHGPPGCSIEGPVADEFIEKGSGYQYLSLRNNFGAGHSRELVDGHSQFMKGIEPVNGYNGPFGYRRNTPWLRAEPSPFGTASRSATH